MAMIDRNFDFATNGTVSAAALHNLIDSATIYQALITGHDNTTSVGTNYELLIADMTNPNAAPNAVTVYDLFQDALTAGTYTNANISEALTYGTATGTRLVSTNATITTGTITTLNSTTGTITTGVIPTLTSSTATFGTTTSTAATITSGTITNLASTTGTIGTLNSTTGTIGNLSTTLAGDFTITQGTGTIGTGVVTAAKMANPQYTGFRNRIINGDMRIDQRSSGSAYAITSSLYGSCDRWASLAGANGVWTQQRVTTGSTDFPFATRVQRVAGSTSTAVGYIGQVIETTNCQDLAGQSATLSFHATAGANFSASGSIVFCEVFTGTGSDQGWTVLNTGSWTGGTQVLNLGQAITTTRTRYSSTVSIPSGINEIAVRFSAVGTGTAGANDWFQITGVQLEAGSTATEFERRPIGTELALCQRYYEFVAFYNGPKYPSAYQQLLIPWKVTKRATPTILTFSDNAGTQLRYSTFTAANAITNGRSPNAYAGTTFHFQLQSINTDTDIEMFIQDLTVSSEL